MGGPSLGLIFDAPGSALRVIQGTPGAATLSDPVAAATAAVVNPRAGAALVYDGSWKLVNASVTDLQLDLPATAQAALSESAAAAVFSVGQVIAVCRLPGASSFTAPAPVTHLAVTDDATIVFSTADTLYVLTPALDLRVAASIPQITSISLIGKSALVTASSQIWRIDDLTGSRQPTLLAQPSTQPVAAALSADGKRLWFVDSATQGVNAIDLATSAQTQIACSCQPTALEPLAGGSAFRITDLNGGPVWLLDTAAADPRIVFVPAIPVQEAQQ